MRQTVGVFRYLSLEWIDALTAEVASSEALRALSATNSIAVTQEVTEGPEGDITYHLRVGDGTAEFGPGAAFPEDLKFRQTWETAVGVATGNLNAQEAFIKGRVLLFGDRQKLLDNQDVFRELEQVFSKVRADTVYE
jgi:hypothetical protein